MKFINRFLQYYERKEYPAKNEQHHGAGPNAASA